MEKLSIRRANQRDAESMAVPTREESMVYV